LYTKENLIKSCNDILKACDFSEESIMIIMKELSLPQLVEFVCGYAYIKEPLDCVEQQIILKRSALDLNDEGYFRFERG